MKETFDIKEVMERYRRGKKIEAAEEMCIQLRPLVFKIVNNYCFNENIREDLEQEGFVSIINGMRCYELEKSSPITYFSRCITNAVRDYAWKDKYKVSRYYMKEISKVKQAVINLESSNIPASVENISEYIKEAIEETRGTMELIYSIDHSFSLDEPDAYELEFTDEQFITIEVEETQEEFYEQLDRLDAYSFEFLCRRFGLGYEKMTRAEMAEHYQITNYKVDKTCHEILGRLEKNIGECEGLIEGLITPNDTMLEKYSKRIIN